MDAPCDNRRRAGRGDTGKAPLPLAPSPNALGEGEAVFGLTAREVSGKLAGKTGGGCALDAEPSVGRSLARIRALLIDMDGVIYFDGATLPGVQEFLSFLRERGIRFAFATNGTNRWPEGHRAKMAGYGIDASDVPIFTAGLAAAEYLAKQGPGRRAYVIGGETLEEQVVQVGGCALDAEQPDYVVVGWSPKFDYDQLETACIAIHRGAKLVLADPDVNDPSPRGPLPGAGAFAAAIMAATGCQAIPIGKPHRAIFEAGLRGLNAEPATSAMLGDRLDSDVAGAAAMGMGSILVLTGLTTPAMLAASPRQPDWVVRNLDELRERWARELG